MTTVAPDPTASTRWELPMAGEARFSWEYDVERQKLLVSLPGKPGNVDFFASTMHVELALLHEEDLLRFLSDLRESGNAYYAVKKCNLSRTGAAATGTGIVPRLRADCDIDLVTVLDGAAKK